MADIAYIQKDSADLLIHYDDGSVRSIYYTNAGLWLPRGANDVPPDPEPGVFKFPFPRSEHTTYPGHSGMDWGKSQGTPIKAVGAGKVIRRTSGYNNSGDQSSEEPYWRGNHIVIDHGDIGGHRIWSLYAHMTNPPTVSLNQNVIGGQQIGGVGNSGFSFGFHLHFEIIFDGVRLETWQGGYERTIGWMDANASGSW